MTYLTSVFVNDRKSYVIINSLYNVNTFSSNQVGRETLNVNCGTYLLFNFSQFRMGLAISLVSDVKEKVISLDVHRTVI